jgi:hypothetical protein
VLVDAIEARLKKIIQGVTSELGMVVHEPLYLTPTSKAPRSSGREAVTTTATPTAAFQTE